MSEERQTASDSSTKEQSNSPRNRTRALDDRSRRRLLQYLGAGTVGTVALPGVVSAEHDTDNHGDTDDQSDISCATGPFTRTYQPFEQTTGDRDVGGSRGEVLEEVTEAVETDEPVDISEEDLRDIDPEAVENDGFEQVQQDVEDVPPEISSTDTPTVADDGHSIDIETEFHGPFDIRGVPSDANIAAGPDHLVVAINSLWAIYDKDGSFQDLFDLQQWFSNAIDRPAMASVRVFDPWVRYDADAEQFYLLATFVDENFNGYMLLSVSDDSDPTGTWYNYGVRPIGPDSFLDFESIGFDSEAVYITENNLERDPDGRFAVDQVTLTILDKNAIGNGEPVTASIFNDLRNPDGTKAFTVRPADQPLLDASADAERPYFMLNVDFSLMRPGFGEGDSLTLWSVTDPLDGPELSCESIPVTPYTLNPFSPQPETDVLLSTRDTRLLTMVYDESDDTLWTAHTIGQDWNGDGNIVSAIQWFEVDPFEAEVVQSGLWGEAGTHYYYPAVNVTEEGMQMVYSVSGEETFARMDIAGRTDDFPEGEIEASTVVQEGESAYTNIEPQPLDGQQFVRWGDYWSVAIDPERNTFWSVAQYSPAEEPALPPGLDLYATRIAETTFGES